MTSTALNRQEQLVRDLEQAHISRSYGAPEATYTLFGVAATEIRELLVHIERLNEALIEARAEMKRQEAMIRDLRG